MQKRKTALDFFLERPPVLFPGEHRKLAWICGEPSRTEVLAQAVERSIEVQHAK